MNIIWSRQAKKDYWQNIDYLEAEWTFQDVTTKQITLYYRIESGKLELLRFWNNYQDLQNFKI